MNNAPPRLILNRTPGEWLSSLPMFFLLLLTLAIGTGEMVHSQLLGMGERMFGDEKAGIQYFKLRQDLPAPSCDPNANLEAEVQKLVAAQQATPTDDISALFGDTAVDEAAIRQSVISAQAACRSEHTQYAEIEKRKTTGLKLYRAVEQTVAVVAHFGVDHRPLILMAILFLAGITATVTRHHISIRPPHSVLDFRVQAIAMTIANAIVTASTVSHLLISQRSGVAVDNAPILYLWIVLFGLLTLINAIEIFRTPKDASAGGHFGAAFLALPLYAVMALVSGIYFLVHSHWSGQAIYLNQMMELSGIFLNLALYIWTGMLLRQTRMVDMFLDILRPWKFSPEMLTYVILLAAALPTAYTGASGIFVIAAGSLIYHEVRQSGASRQFALAATAMSGSLGVVLRPCLLVVLIAALNKQVTTAQLYDWGLKVFLLTSTLFFIFSQLSRTQKIQIEKPSVAIPGMLRALTPAAPYVLVIGAVVMAYSHLVDTKLNEFTAPVIIPVIMLVVVIFDKLRHRQPAGEAQRATLAHQPERRHGVEAAIREATNQTIGHIGALIMLMALSLAIGGVIERSQVMDYAPHHFANAWLAMTFLMVTKVLLGMVMDPFGAVILVSGTLAPIAYANGIDPVHFWMMVLVAFELGYLLPPVALNQLLTRQTVGEAEFAAADAEVQGQSFYRRHERWVLPVIVMSIGMIVVAYGPLIVFGK